MIASLKAAPAWPVQTPGPPSAGEQAVENGMTVKTSMDHVKLLSQTPRVASTPEYLKAAEYVVEQAKKSGWDARIEQVPLSSALQDASFGERMLFNVVAERKGTAPDGERALVLAGAHLDSVPRGPGANDNASGSAALLQMASVLGDQPTRNDLRFIWFDGEEQGLLGSRAYTQLHRDELKKNAIAMVNADMIASPHGSVGFDVGRREGQQLTKAVSAIADRNGIPARVNRPHSRSDHAAFDAIGVPSVDFGVSVDDVFGEDPNYHRPTDTHDKLNQSVYEEFGDLFALTVYNLGQQERKLPLR